MSISFGNHPVRDGLSDSMFTALFALARTVGWVAQWNEMISDPDQKIGRPASSTPAIRSGITSPSTRGRVTAGMPGPETLIDRLEQPHQPPRRDPSAYIPKLITVLREAMAALACAPT